MKHLGELTQTLWLAMRDRRADKDGLSRRAEQSMEQCTCYSSNIDPRLVGSW